MTLPPDSAEPGHEEQLRALVERGFKFVHPTDAHGQLAEVVGVRVHDDVVDVVKLRGEHDVLAMRLPSGEVDVLAPREVLWQSTGHVARVLKELLALPECNAEDRPERAAGCWIPVGPGESKWVTADA